MRVLHVSPYFAPALNYGGPPASVLGLCQGLQRIGVDVEVLTTTANGGTPLKPSPPEGEQYEGVPVRYLAQAFPRRFFGARVRAPLAEALRRADICHIHGVWNVPEWSASRLARARHVPYVLSPRGMLQPQARRHGRWRKAVAYRLFERANLKAAAHLHGSSDQEVDALRDLALGVPISMIPNAVDLDAATAAPRGYRARLGIPPDAFVVLSLGRIHRIKRLDLLADAFAQLRETDRSAHLVLAGPDEQGLVVELALQLAAHAAYVHMIGPVLGPDKWALVRDADVTVQCSDSESFGMAVAESLAAGVPVVATRTIPWSALETRGCGRWVDQRADAIAAALRELARDPARRATLSTSAVAFARETFGSEAVAGAMRQLYDEALAERC